MNTPSPDLAKKISAKSNNSQDSVDMVFPHLNRKVTLDTEDSKNPYSVSHPVKGSHVSYTVKGIDNDGSFEGSRRYNDFFHFRNALVTRWPGVYFPPIPPKKKVGNKEHKFLEERRYFLERFLRKLAKLDFILESEEFKIFSRLNGDIEKSIVRLPTLTHDLLLDRFRNSFKFEESPSQDKILKCRAVIAEFSDYHSKILPVLELIKEQVKGLAPVTQGK